MTSLDLSSLTNLTGQLGNLMPSGQQILEGVLTGAAVTTVTKGLQAGGAASLDPLGLFQHSAAAAAPVAATNNPNVVTGPTITASAFSALPPASQGTLLAAGVHIVQG
jgi:hypothetical protein